VGMVDAVSFDADTSIRRILQPPQAAHSNTTDTRNMVFLIGLL